MSITTYPCGCVYVGGSQFCLIHETGLALKSQADSLRAELAEVRGKLEAAESCLRRCAAQTTESTGDIEKDMQACAAAAFNTELLEVDDLINSRFADMECRLARAVQRAEAAEHRLATLPDGDEPITEEWFTSIGANASFIDDWFQADFKQGEIELTILPEAVQISDGEDSIYLKRRIKTRGDVLRLMAALGIAAQERK